jgi:hypothetical protein
MALMIRVQVLINVRLKEWFAKYHKKTILAT